MFQLYKKHKCKKVILPIPLFWDTAKMLIFKLVLGKYSIFPPSPKRPVSRIYLNQTESVYEKTNLHAS